MKGGDMWPEWQLICDNHQPDEARLQALLVLQRTTLTPYGRQLLLQLVYSALPSQSANPSAPQPTVTEPDQQNLAQHHSTQHATGMSDKLIGALIMVVGNSLSDGHEVADWAWIRPFLAESQPALIRRCAIQTLADSHHPDVVPWLVPCLRHEDKGVFADAAQSLGQFGYNALPYLLPLLEGESTPLDIQCVAAWQLGELKSYNSLTTLLKVAESPTRHTDVRALAIWALGQIGHGSPSVIKVLQQCEQEAEPDIRLRAQTALKKVLRNSN
jgi:hypothetical protein